MQEPSSLTLRGPVLQSAAAEVRELTVVIERGIVTAVTEPAPSDLSFDRTCLILPGFIDLHVHCREDSSGRSTHKEEYVTAGHAALKGGVTAFADMPNTPVPACDAATLREKEPLARRAAVDTVLYALASLEAAPFERNVPYKLYLSEQPPHTDEDLARFFERFAATYVAIHPEDPEVLRRCAAAATHEERRPPEAECEAVRRVLRCLARNPCLHVHLCHLSVAESIRLCGEAKRKGLPVTCEVCLHHLLFDLEQFPAGLRAFRNVNPPLRTAADRSALKEALAQGKVDVLATDHAPHTRSEKRAGASGFPGLDAFGPAVTALSEEIPLARLLQAASCAPARIWQRFTGQRRGVIEEGAVGSLTVLRTQVPGGYRMEKTLSKCGWSPYEGLWFPGCTEATVVRGRLAYLRT